MPNRLRSLILEVLKQHDYPVERDYRLVATEDIKQDTALNGHVFRIERIGAEGKDESGDSHR